MNRGTGITRREREVWSLVAQHLSNQEIADRLFLSVRTVESHVSSLIQKLQVADRRALARHAAATPVQVPRWPAPASSFIGREAECAALLEAATTQRMVTATGPGGVGKTRLALRVAEQLAAARRDGARFIGLAQVNDPEMVVAALAEATGVVAPLGGSLADAVIASLADSDALLLFDNCEHVLDAVREQVRRLLGQCPRLGIVATSRVPLRTPFEWLFAVPGLSVHEAGGDAVELFVERARAAGVPAELDRALVVAVCASLDGMALAIELAAARCPALGLDGLLAGLDRGLRMLGGQEAGEHRHRSLRDTITWSYRLLTQADRELLDAISVFASWFDVAAALAIVGGPLQRFDVAEALARLAEHSLLLVEHGMPTRYRALEPIRQFGAEQLDQTGRHEAVASRHRRWCLATLAVLAQQGRDDAWCERLDGLAADARAALAWVEARQGAPDAAALAERLAEQLLLRGRPHESQRSYEQAAAHAEKAEQARLLRLAAGAAATRLVGQETLRLLDEAAAVALANGDATAAAEDLAWTAIYLRYAPGIIAIRHEASESESRLARAADLAGGAAAAEATIAIAMAYGLRADDERTTGLVVRAGELARTAGRPLIESLVQDQRCTYHANRGELGLAIAACERRAEVLGRLPLDAATAFQFNDHLLMASEAQLSAGQLRAATAYAEQLAEQACYRDYPHPALARRIPVDLMAGDLEAAVLRGDRFREAWERAGRPLSGTLSVATYAMATVHGLLGDMAERQRWLTISRCVMLSPERLEGCSTGVAPALDALLALDQGRPEAAVQRLSTDIDDPDAGTWQFFKWRPWYAALWAEAAVLAGHPEAALRLQRAAAATRENPIAAQILKRADDLLHGRQSTLHLHAQVFEKLGCDYQRRRTEKLAGSVPEEI